MSSDETETGIHGSMSDEADTAVQSSMFSDEMDSNAQVVEGFQRNRRRHRQLRRRWHGDSSEDSQSSNNEGDSSSTEGNSLSDQGFATSSGEDHSEYEEVLRHGIREDRPPIPDCEPIGREGWEGKALRAVHPDGSVFAIVFVVAIDVYACVDGEQLLGEDHLGVVPLEIINGDRSLRDQLLRWPTRALFNGDVSVYNHGQRQAQLLEEANDRRQAKGSHRSYNSSRLARNRPIAKSEHVMSNESINEVFSQFCCEHECVNKFSAERIRFLRKGMHGGSVEARKQKLLEVHGMIHPSRDGMNEVITLYGQDVCIASWIVMHAISERTFRRHRGMYMAGHTSTPHGNAGRRRPREATEQAIATLETLVEGIADQPPHMTRTLESGEKVLQRILPTGTHWKEFLPIINQVNEQNRLKKVSLSSLSRIRKKHFGSYTIKRRGDSFARCSVCDKLRKLEAAFPPGSLDFERTCKRLNDHHLLQGAARQAYYKTRSMSANPDFECICFIHDKMDHKKTASPCFAHRIKKLDGLMKLPVAVTGMLTHGHGDLRYAHYSLDVFPSDSNFTIGSFAKLLRDLENLPASSSRQLFNSSGNSPLYRALLRGSEMCLTSLPPPLEQPRTARPLPPRLYVQLDNSWKDNKNRYVFCFWSLMVAKRIVNEVVVSYMIVGHTHDDIDALFGRWAMSLRSHDFPTLPLLMKSFMDLEKEMVIPHVIEEVPDFKEFIKPYMASKKSKSLFGHSKGRQFRFFVHTDGWPLMQFKLKCTDKTWLPQDRPGIRLWQADEYDRPRIPLIGSPDAVHPSKMGNCAEIIRGLTAYIAYWNALLSEEGTTEAFRERITNYMAYWTGVVEAISAPHVPAPVQPAELRNGFWPKTRQPGPSNNGNTTTNQLSDSDEGDDHFIGAFEDRPARSFNIARDVSPGHLLFIRPAEASEEPVWLAMAMGDPQLDQSLPHFREILVRWFVPFNTRASDMATRYSGWNTRTTFSWKKDPMAIEEVYIITDSIMASWEPEEGPNARAYHAPRSQIRFTMDNMRRIADAEMVVD